MIYTIDNPKLIKCFCCFKDKENFTGVAKDKNNDIAYFLNGKYHRTDGPAIIYYDGSKEWWLNGELHREDGPAIEIPKAYKAWYLNGNFHRVDGPAVEYANGDKSWWLNGSCYGKNDSFTIESWIRFVKLQLLK